VSRRETVSAAKLVEAQADGEVMKAVGELSVLQVLEAASRMPEVMLCELMGACTFCVF
jgi:hypothetical protein